MKGRKQEVRQEFWDEEKQKDSREKELPPPQDYTQAIENVRKKLREGEEV